MRSAARVRIPPTPPRRRKRYAACGGFFIKNHRRAHFAASPFPKKGTLLACKRVCDASAFCQPFSGTNSPSENADISFLCAFHILLLFPQKRHACIAAGINAPATAPLRCRFFACGEIQIWQGIPKEKARKHHSFGLFYMFIFSNADAV